MDSSTTSIVSALGAGSGVDMARLAADLSAARFAMQVQQLEARSEQMETRISAAAALKGQLSQLASALGDRIRTGDLAPRATISNPSVASASVTPGARPAGSFSLEVSQLAKGQVLASRAYPAAGSTVGEGLLTITFGTQSGTGFAADIARSPVEIAVTADDTLQTLAAKIGASGNGLVAYVAVTGTGAQLVVKGPEGAANGFTLTGSGASASGVDGSGNPVAPTAGNIDYLDWTPVTDAGRQTQVSRNAAFALDGVEMTSASNTVANLPGGLKLVLAGTNVGAPATISFAGKDAEIRSLMEDFAAALNDVTAQLRETADPQGGELGADPGARALKRMLRGLTGQIVMPGAAAGAPATLADLGLSFTRDGIFRVDGERLSRTLAEQPEAAAAMFTTGIYGLYATMDKLARDAGSFANPGSLGGSISRYEKRNAAIEDKLADIADKQAALREQMTRQFTAADRRVASSQSTLTFLRSQIDAWNSARD
ncbi:flagellar filament capping protein FliD [Aurantiacibacter luteus]|uniref:Flagellar hook-associated protein 2 n=1 Tax=Aurantiacibacter luteus TaxID=1581420 RepID=A0A0G9MKR3_9SPHN|nr:flagellar filament capping protein FliD [Aurantiacibacter luteus]KLE31275.1 hypothetical protein AAW00_14025 [Aurantiacibacter luteus]